MSKTSNGLILIVDDDLSICESTASLLKSVGYKVKCFSSAEEFLASIHLLDVACLILDFCMTGMNGLQLQKRLNANKYNFPTIFITAHACKGVETEATRRGAVQFLHKPFSADELIGTLRSILDLPEKH